MVSSIALVIVAIAVAAPPAPESSPVPAEESLRYVQLPDDLAIELVAAEPQVVDPIDIRFDELGRMYVVEMRDYPSGPPGGGPPLSRIKLLEDRDGDGRFETAHLFAENLSFATGVQPWNGGVIVTLAGRVAWLKDTNGDYKADVEETWFTGFAEENSQLRANHPRFAHDNHIYIANGLRGGKVIDKRREGVEPINISGRDFRFDPRGTLAEAVTGVGQYGLCFDDFGNRFVCQNRNPLQHVVFEERDLRKSKHYTPPAVMNDVAAFAENSKLFPLTKTWTTSNLHENTFTAACGVNIYRGNALPETYRGLAFTCDPTGNLVHAERMQAWGPTFQSKPLYEGKEFLASTDEWFRPVAIENGPDGALYIVDMYRAVIEHPDFVPDELKRRPDQRLGDDRGRIYRIVAKDHKRAAIALPGKADKEALVRLLAHENAWQRETAQRLLGERGEKDVKEAVAKLIEHDRPEVVFQALWTLQGLDELNAGHLSITARRKDNHIALATAKLFEVTGQRDAALRNAIVDGPDIHGREHIGGLWIAMTPLSSRELGNRVSHVAAFGQDAWSRYEVLLTLQSPARGAWQAILDNTDERSPGTKGYSSPSHFASFSRELGRIAGEIDDPKEIEASIAFLQEVWGRDSNFEYAQSSLLGFAEGLAKQKRTLSEYATNNDAKAVLLRMTKVSIAGAADGRSLAEHRLIDVDLLTHLDTPECRETLQKLTHDHDQIIRTAAIKAGLAGGDKAVARELLDRARGESPATRRVILEGLIARPNTLPLVLDALEAEELRPADLDATLLPRLLNTGDAALKSRAQKLLAPPPDADRQQISQRYTAALKQDSDSIAGKSLFEKNCATCHRVGDVGVNVAPDISDSRTKTAEQILLDILEPNRAVDGNYVAYVVSTADGKTLSGVIAAETSQAITLKQPGGQTAVVPKAEIEEMISTGKSLMPEGLERAVPPEQMAQLVSYIKNWRYLDGRIPASTVKAK